MSKMQTTPLLSEPILKDLFPGLDPTIIRDLISDYGPQSDQILLQHLLLLTKDHWIRALKEESQRYV